MKRILNVFDLFGIGYGDLGSSIYYALGIVTAYALGATPLALICSGFVFVSTAFTYAELSSILPESGGSASFSRKAFNDFISFIAGWGLLLDYIVTISISAISVGPYFSIFFPSLRINHNKMIFTVILIATLIIINILSNKKSTMISFLLTLFAVITQLILIIMGFIFLFHFPHFFSHIKIGGSDPLWSPTWGQFLHGVAMAMVAYTGIESMVQLSEEAQSPKQTVPRAIMATMTTILTMYIGLSVIALSAMNPKELSTTYLNNPISGIAASLPGRNILEPWVGLLGGILLSVAANAGLVGSSRLSFNMGEYLQLPRLFHRLHKQFKTPYPSLLIFGSLSILVIIWTEGKIDYLADIYNFGAMLAFFCAHISLISNRLRYPRIPRPFKAPFNISIQSKSISITTIIGAISCLIVWLLVILTKEAARFVGFSWLAIGIILYIVHRTQHNISPIARIQIEKIPINELTKEIKKIFLLTKSDVSVENVYFICTLAEKFRAQINYIKIVEIPVSLLVNIRDHEKEKRELYHSSFLKAKHIAKEKGIHIVTKIIYTKSLVLDLHALIEKEKCDLLILEASSLEDATSYIKKIFQALPCRVMILRSL